MRTFTEKELFPEERLKAKQEFYDTYEPNFRLFQMREIDSEGPIKNLFYGDSITAVFPLQNFFPNHSILNKSIPGDNVWGMYMRLEEDLFRYKPERVFLMGGINGIGEDEELIVQAFQFLCRKIKDSGASVVLCSMTPLREGDKWERFQFMDKIVRINNRLREWALRELDGHVDYFSATVDETGQLASECAMPDGTHLTIKGYIRMAPLLKPYLL